ncbi:unnamed protein product [Arctogadus glacialis]
MLVYVHVFTHASVHVFNHRRLDPSAWIPSSFSPTPDGSSGGGSQPAGSALGRGETCQKDRRTHPSSLRANAVNNTEKQHHIVTGQ